jgi:hypothetical protein
LTVCGRVLPVDAHHGQFGRMADLSGREAVYLFKLLKPESGPPDGGGGASAGSSAPEKPDSAAPPR